MPYEETKGTLTLLTVLIIQGKVTLSKKDYTAVSNFSKYYLCWRYSLFSSIGCYLIKCRKSVDFITCYISYRDDMTCDVHDSTLENCA